MSSRDTIVLLDDNYLFKQLARRDFDHDGRLSAEIENCWTWKRLYRALIGLRRQFIHEMEIVRGLSFSCHGPQLSIAPVPLRMHIIHAGHNDDSDDEDFDPHQVEINVRTGWARSVILDEQRQLLFVADDADALIATRNYVNLEAQSQIHENKIMHSRFNPAYDTPKTPPNGFRTTFVKEGLCVWVEADKFKHCRYKMFYPMSKLRRVFEQCRLYVEDRVAVRRAAVDKVLNEQLSLKYKVDKPELIGQYTEFIWGQLKRIFTRAELEIVQMKIDGDILEFVVNRKIEWVHARLCMSSDCIEKLPRRLFNTPYDTRDIYEVMRRHLCDYHLAAEPHYNNIGDIIEQRLHLLEAERLNFFARHFKCPDQYLNLDVSFSISISPTAILRFARVDVKALGL